MPRFLSPEWLAAVSTDDQAEGEPEIRIHQVVTGGTDGDIEYTVEIRAAGARLVPGPPPVEAHIRMTQDYETAKAIHTGRLTIDAALSAGRVRVTGDTGRLVAAGPSLAAAERAAAERRSHRRHGHGPTDA
jgi:hypothetical protein